MSCIRSVFVVSAALLTAIQMASPAVAERYAGTDPAGDMTVQDPHTGAWTPAPTHRRLDIRRVFVRHTDQVVKIRIVVRGLTRPQGDESFHLGGDIKVDRRAQPGGAQAFERSAWQWDVHFNQHHGRRGYAMWVVDSDYQEVYGCEGGTDGLNAIAHYDGNWITVTVPRHCLTSNDLGYAPPLPRWVRVSVATQHFPGVDRPSYLDLSPFTPRLYPG